METVPSLRCPGYTQQTGRHSKNGTDVLVIGVIILQTRRWELSYRPALGTSEEENGGSLGGYTVGRSEQAVNSWLRETNRWGTTSYRN